MSVQQRAIDAIRNDAKCYACGKGLDDISISYLVLLKDGRTMCARCREWERQLQAPGDAA